MEAAAELNPPSPWPGVLMALGSSDHRRTAFALVAECIEEAYYFLSIGDRDEAQRHLREAVRRIQDPRDVAAAIWHTLEDLGYRRSLDTPSDTPSAYTAIECVLNTWPAMEVA